MSETTFRNLARAICKSKTCRGFKCCQWPAQMGERHNCPVDKGGCDDAVRAILRELREPTEDMQVAGQNAILGADDVIVRPWQAIIDHILSEDE